VKQAFRLSDYAALRLAFPTPSYNESVDSRYFGDAKGASELNEEIRRLSPSARAARCVLGAIYWAPNILQLIGNCKGLLLLGGIAISIALGGALPIHHCAQRSILR
jgi:hypothetical protein